MQYVFLIRSRAGGNKYVTRPCMGQRPFLYLYWTILVQVIVMQACFSETQCTLQLVLTITVSRFSNTIQEAQLSLRNCALLHVPEYFAKSLKIIQTGNIQKLGHGFLFAFHSNYGSILYHFRDSDILVDNREFFIAMHSTPPLRGGVAVGILPHCLVSNNWMALALLHDGEKKFEGMFSRFDRIPACDVTDRQTSRSNNHKTLTNSCTFSYCTMPGYIRYSTPTAPRLLPASIKYSCHYYHSSADGQCH